MMRRTVLIGASAAALLLGAPSLRQAAAQALERACVTIYNAQGVLDCVEGWLPFQLQSLSSPVISIKSQPAKLSHLNCYNPNTTAVFVQLFDTATSNTIIVGTTSPVVTMAVPALTSTFFGNTDIGVIFRNGMSIAATSTVTGTVGPATALNCNVNYD